MRGVLGVDDVNRRQDRERNQQEQHELMPGLGPGERGTRHRPTLLVAAVGDRASRRAPRRIAEVAGAARPTVEPIPVWACGRGCAVVSAARSRCSLRRADSEIAEHAGQLLAGKRADVVVGPGLPEPHCQPRGSARRDRSRSDPSDLEVVGDAAFIPDEERHGAGMDVVRREREGELEWPARIDPHGLVDRPPLMRRAYGVAVFGASRATQIAARTPTARRATAEGYAGPRANRRLRSAGGRRASTIRRSTGVPAPCASPPGDCANALIVPAGRDRC